jgi:hypothetical protein
MGFLWFGRKKKQENKKNKEDIDAALKKTSEWIKHLHTKDGHHEINQKELDSRLTALEEDVAEIKQTISFFGPRMFKQRQTAVYKQTGVQGVQTGVQTGVQNFKNEFKNSILGHLSVMERAIVWVLLNTDKNMKLSYEDISLLLGKDKATIRGQINSIRQKSEGIIEELIEKNGKKRVYIPEEMREILLKP